MEVLAEIRYKKLSRIGAGQGMNSEVFLAFDPQLNGQIAVKEVEKSQFGNDVTAYYNEAQIMFAVPHQNVVAVQYACQTPHKICLAMRYFPQGSLLDKISQQALRLRQVLRIGQGILNGLAKIHREGFVHFDVKPSNILFDNNNVPLVADFGQSRKLKPDGTVEIPDLYLFGIPPETLMAGKGTVQSDVFQAGLTLYRAINGDRHYELQTAGLDENEVISKIISGSLPDRDLFLPHVPKRLRTIIRKALKLAPADRFSSAIEFADALAKVPVELDWEMTRLPDGRVRWKADRQDQPDLILELIAEASSKWRVECVTSRAGVRRARTKFQRSNLSLKDANRHLKTVFEELGG